MLLSKVQERGVVGNIGPVSMEETEKSLEELEFSMFLFSRKALQCLVIEGDEN